MVHPVATYEEYHTYSRCLTTSPLKTNKYVVVLCYFKTTQRYYYYCTMLCCSANPIWLSVIWFSHQISGHWSTLEVCQPTVSETKVPLDIVSSRRGLLQNKRSKQGSTPCCPIYLFNPTEVKKGTYIQFSLVWVR